MSADGIQTSLGLGGGLHCHTEPSFCTVSPKVTVTVTSVNTRAQHCSKQLDMSVYSVPSTSGRQGLIESEANIE